MVRLIVQPEEIEPVEDMLQFALQTMTPCREKRGRRKIPSCLSASPPSASLHDLPKPRTMHVRREMFQIR